MGDTAVDIFLETLNQLLTSSNLDFILDKKDQLKSLENEIKYLREFLKITEKKRNEHSEVMKLVVRIRDVVSDAENIVADHQLFVSHDSEEEEIVELFVSHDSKKKNIVQLLMACWCGIYDSIADASEKKKKKAICEHDSMADALKKKAAICEHQDHLPPDIESVKNEIQALTVEVNKMYKENMYDINGVAVKKMKPSSPRIGGSSGGSNTSIVVEKKVVVGFKEEVHTLMGKIHDSEEGGPLEIISIVGAGGSGKTTLAREVYDHPLTLQKFEIRAWFNVSQDYNKTMKRDFLISIMESASLEKKEDYLKSSEDKLGEKVYKCLLGRKYLIFIDDIWDIEAWNDIQRSFPRECKGSKVSLTSRLPVQPVGIGCVFHHLDPLPKSYSWELLEKKVFKGKPCPPELVDFGKQIAEKCEGLPLAIVAIAGILAKDDKTLDVWEQVAKYLNSTIAKKEKGCMKILELSYNHLPLHLKACFLYIGAYPEDYEILLRELIWLWIAEGFIQKSAGGKSLEAIAEDYLNSLVDRSLVMVARKSKSHGGIKACRIHDLLRELCLKKAKEDNFFAKIYEGDSFSPYTSNKLRRLFISHQFFHKSPQRLYARNLRSFLHHSLPNSSHSSFNLSFLVENFELLRVLHLQSVNSLGEIGMGDLVHLRYLALMLKPGYQRLNFFTYLSNLEILNLKHGFLSGGIELPRNIFKMVKLRHLYTKYGLFKCPDVSNDEDKGNRLDSLQTMYQMCMCKRCVSFLERTPNLRKLGLQIGDGRNFILPLFNLELLNCLETLSFRFSYREADRMKGLSLKLPPTLRQLSLKDTQLDWKDLSKILQTVPSLEVLKLSDSACIGLVWDTSELEEEFSQLKFLKLDHNRIHEWKVSEDQFPRLEVLDISGCSELQRLPIDFANLNELRKIRIRACNQSLVFSAREIQEEQRNSKGDDGCLYLVQLGNKVPVRGHTGVVIEVINYSNFFGLISISVGSWRGFSFGVVEMEPRSRIVEKFPFRY